MKLEIIVYLDSKYERNGTFEIELIADIDTHQGKGRKRIVEEVEKRFPKWYSFDINRIENQSVRK